MPLVQRMLASVFQYIKPATAAIRRVDDTAIVDEHVIDSATALARRRFRQESGDFFRTIGVGDVVDPQSRAECKRAYCY